MVIGILFLTGAVSGRPIRTDWARKQGLVKRNLKKKIIQSLRNKVMRNVYMRKLNL